VKERAGLGRVGYWERGGVRDCMASEADAAALSTALRAFRVDVFENIAMCCQRKKKGGKGPLGEQLAAWT
jgi:hypothetical protein